MANKEIMKDVNGNILSEREEKMRMLFQTTFNRIKSIIKSKLGDSFVENEKVSKSLKEPYKKRLMIKDINFYNDYVGSIWDTKPIHNKTKEEK